MYLYKTSTSTYFVLCLRICSLTPPNSLPLPSGVGRRYTYLEGDKTRKEILKIFNCIFNFYLPILSPFFPLLTS